MWHRLSNHEDQGQEQRRLPTHAPSGNRVQVNLQWAMGTSFHHRKDQALFAELGNTPVDCEGSFRGAMAAAETAAYELAVVELHLKGESAFRILDKLIPRGIPYILATCAARADIPPPIPRRHLSANRTT